MKEIILFKEIPLKVLLRRRLGLILTGVWALSCCIQSSRVHFAEIRAFVEGFSVITVLYSSLCRQSDTLSIQCNQLRNCVKIKKGDMDTGKGGARLQ